MKVYDTISDLEYYGQTNSKLPLLSASYAKLMHKTCPAMVYNNHPKLGGGKSVNSPAFDTGKAFHALILEDKNALAQIVVIDAADYRKKEAKEARDFAYANHAVPILIKEWEKLRLMAEKVKKYLDDFFPMVNAQHEIELAMDFNYYGAKSRCRHDWISKEEFVSIDYKTTADASTEACKKAIRRYGYDIQAAMYLAAARKFWPGPWQFFFIFVEKKPPFLTNVIKMSDDYLEVGDAKASAAADLWNDCLKSGIWPGYGYHEASPNQWEYDLYTQYKGEVNV